jgi:hypothetical protein
MPRATGRVTNCSPSQDGCDHPAGRRAAPCRAAGAQARPRRKRTAQRLSAARATAGRGAGPATGQGRPRRAARAAAA